MSDESTRPASPARVRMIEVAEQLFAERGLEGVSLRTVGLAAGQRNNSAAQYHFGSRDGLVEAVIAHRSAAVGERRAELTAALLTEQATPDLAALVRCFVLPLAELVARGSTTQPTWYLRFLAQVVEYQGGHAAARMAPRPHQLQDLEAAMRAQLPHVAAPDYARRQRWIAQITLRVLADQEYEVAAGRRTAPMERVVDDLVAMLVALLQAP